MQNLFILLKGQAKALDIESIIFDTNKSKFAVKFFKNPKIYHYNQSDVLIIKEVKAYPPEACRVFVNSKLRTDISEILCFSQGSFKHWRITYTDNSRCDFKNSEGIEVKENCLSEAVAHNVFEYLKSIARSNSLGRNEDSKGILFSQYSKIDYIEKELAIVPFLYSELLKPRKNSTPSLVFPFGCNASQKSAVTEAFTNQLSVVQGPPGTGKTQTILNIIANIIIQGKTVIVVSNNNSATANVLEKLEKYGMGFIVASLGSRENKERFIKNLPPIPTDIETWELECNERDDLIQRTKEALNQLDDIFNKQERLSKLQLEFHSLKLEQEHFLLEYKDVLMDIVNYRISSSTLMSWWIKFQKIADNEGGSKSGIFRKIRWWWNCRQIKHIVNNVENLSSIIIQLQGLYYQKRICELQQEIDSIENDLKNTNSKFLMENLSSSSMSIFKDALALKYKKLPLTCFADVKDISKRKDEFCKRFPIVLSTTFSSQNSVQDQVYDYLIMDEASQVAIETGALALTCARNAVIVGDMMQLPNVVTEEDKLKLNAIFNEYKLDEGFNSAEYSFLESICKIIPDIKQTLLREHYRCHPRIINFCNQKFYGGELLIMTQDNGEPDVLSAIKCAQGHHARGHYNQREIDVISQELLPNIGRNENLGIISPYNDQVDAINAQIGGDIAATVHKYQGREKDTIIFSVVDDEITDFSDDANMLNVAISRAKKNFKLVVTGNEQTNKGNITDLIEYIEYNNCQVIESKVHSIFDILYSAYSIQRQKLLSNTKKVSIYDSENLVYSLIIKILQKYNDFHCYGVLTHYPLRLLISDTSLMTKEERIYASRMGTHIDFLVYSRVTKKPKLAIEVDGYSFHNAQTEQYERDTKKDIILKKYALPLLRLSTVGSGEEQKIFDALANIK